MSDRFHFYHFSPLLPEAIIGRFPELNIYQTMEVYGYWLRKFDKRSWSFYRSQYNNHVEYAAHGVNNEYSLERHSEELHFTMLNLEELVKQFAPEVKTTFSMQDLVGDHYDYISALVHDHYHPRLYRRRLDEIWFNTTINRPSEVTHLLRNMQYDKYLMTGHWREVRAAMLLVQGARCHSTRCFGVGEGYWEGWEVDMHVHHLTYKNRGNERYADLMLLCNRCHEAFHSGHHEIIPVGAA